VGDEYFGFRHIQTGFCDGLPVLIIHVQAVHHHQGGDFHFQF
jgi:hypothetical protein